MFQDFFRLVLVLTLVFGSRLVSPFLGVKFWQMPKIGHFWLQTDPQQKSIPRDQGHAHRAHTQPQDMHIVDQDHRDEHADDTSKMQSRKRLAPTFSNDLES